MNSSLSREMVIPGVALLCCGEIGSPTTPSETPKGKDKSILFVTDHDENLSKFQILDRPTAKLLKRGPVVSCQ